MHTHAHERMDVFDLCRTKRETEPTSIPFLYAEEEVEGHDP